MLGTALYLDFIRIKHENNTLKSFISKLKEKSILCQTQLKIHQNELAIN